MTAPHHKDISDIFTGPLLKTIGNVSIMAKHISTLKASLDIAWEDLSDEESTDDFYHSSNYYCWLLMHSVYFYIKMEKIGLRLNLPVKISDDDLLESIASNVPDARDKILTLRELRYRFVHYGMPNPQYRSNNDQSRYAEKISKIASDFEYASALFEDCNKALSTINLPDIHYGNEHGTILTIAQH